MLSVLPSLAIVIIAAFFFGSLPLAKVVTRCLTLGGKLGDVRYVALIRVFTDITKGSVAVAFGHEFGIMAAQVAALFVYLGHIFPLGAGFGQQNGTGTLLGALIILDPTIGLIALSTWMFAYYIYRHATYAALISACATTIFFFMAANTTEVRIELLVVMTCVVLWRHRRHIHIRI